ncbi:MAG: hypothetical protein J7K26_01955, partial [Candidatus Aenigmarchaeota archaeon]|nr:hypothetical protein [Candidatus Aenigmarchaeota archaeon]
ENDIIKITSAEGASQEIEVKSIDFDTGSIEYNTLSSETGLGFKGEIIKELPGGTINERDITSSGGTRTVVKCPPCPVCEDLRDEFKDHCEIDGYVWLYDTNYSTFESNQPNCCGDDPNEYYKKEEFGQRDDNGNIIWHEACCDKNTDCIYVDDQCYSSDTKINNIRMCYNGSIYMCTIDSYIGKQYGSYCCAGTSSSHQWTNSPLEEVDYSCYDNIDNDCDGLIDMDDPSCAGIEPDQDQTKCQYYGWIFGSVLFDQSTNAPSGDCCGDDINEFVKTSYNNEQACCAETQCADSNGGCTDSDNLLTNETQYLCYNGTINKCTNSSDLGKHVGSYYCVGWGNVYWSTDKGNEYDYNPTYACTDGYDNDADGLIDEQDPDCTNNIKSQCTDMGYTWLSCFVPEDTTTPNCCGDDPNEYAVDLLTISAFGFVIKTDGACSSDPTNCVYYSGASKTYYNKPSDYNVGDFVCYNSVWKECSSDSHIPGLKHGSYCCAVDSSGSYTWTETPYSENWYSCSDNIDNDCDGLTDCDDPDCSGTAACP